MRSDTDDGEWVGDDALWAPWTPDEVASRLTGSHARWYVVAGWAVDLFHGRRTRAHHDIEIGVARDDFALLRASFSEFEFDVVGSGRRWPLSTNAFDEHFQTWLRDAGPDTGPYHLDVFRDPHDGSEWICRRDAQIHLPYEQVVRHSDTGIPYMSPEIVLLFKAKHLREKDQQDFECLLPLLDAQQIEWLRTSLEIVHPDHEWITLLSQ
ncbi:MAG: hypothetical protein WCF25_06225 [Acidimicrobiales bacterium]